MILFIFVDSSPQRVKKVSMYFKSCDLLKFETPINSNSSCNFYVSGVYSSESNILMTLEMTLGFLFANGIPFTIFKDYLPETIASKTLSG
jgi:hypothetical protein